VEKKRLSKTLASAGVASRRACEELIFDGRVKVNNQVVLVPQTLVDISVDQILVDGTPVGAVESKVYYILNKPAGYVCSARGNSSTPLVIDLFKDAGCRLFTVGRLDKDTKGLLVVTNDGHFANRVIHPSANIQKEYLAKTDQEITHEHLITISQGTLVEGVYVKPIKVSKVRRGVVKITLSEGKKHEVRLLLQAAGLQVNELTRIRLGHLVLGDIPEGSWRPLTEKEKNAFSDSVDSQAKA